MNFLPCTFLSVLEEGDLVESCGKGFFGSVLFGGAPNGGVPSLIRGAGEEPPPGSCLAMSFNGDPPQKWLA